MEDTCRSKPVTQLKQTIVNTSRENPNPLQIGAERTTLFLIQKENVQFVALRLRGGRLGFLTLVLGGRGRLLFRLVFLRSSTLGLLAIGRSPKGKVVTQELHDKGAVTVAFLRERIKLGDGIIESLLGKVAGTIGRVQDLVVEHGEVQGKTQADGVSGGEISLGNVGGVLVQIVSGSFSTREPSSIPCRPRGQQ